MSFLSRLLVSMMLALTLASVSSVSSALAQTTAIPPTNTSVTTVGQLTADPTKYIQSVQGGTGIRVVDGWCPRGAICGTTGKDVATPKAFSNFVLRIVGGVLSLAAAIAVVMLVVAGLRLVIAGGDSDAVGKAHTMMKWTFAGLAVIAVSLIIVKNVTQTVFEIVPADAKVACTDTHVVAAMKSGGAQQLAKKCTTASLQALAKKYGGASGGKTCDDADVVAALTSGGAQQLASTCSTSSLQSLAGKYSGGSAGGAAPKTTPASGGGAAPMTDAEKKMREQAAPYNNADCSTASVNRGKAAQELLALKSKVDGQCSGFIGGVSCTAGGWFNSSSLYAQIDAKQAEYDQWRKKNDECMKTP